MKVFDVLKTTKLNKAEIGSFPYLEIGDIDIINKTYNYKDKNSVNGAIIANKNSILVSTVRPTRGAITILKEDKVAVSNAFAILEVDESKCLTKYLFYLLNSNNFYQYLGLNSKGATYPTCSKNDVYNYIIKIPSIKEQELIVSIFDCVTNSINLKKIQLEYFDELVKSQFIEMFESENYPVKTIFDTCTLKSGTTFKKNEESEKGEILYAKVSDMNLPENEKYMVMSKTYVSRKTAGNTLIPSNSIIFPKRGGAIGTNKKRICTNEICVDLNTMAVTPNSELDIQYLYQYFINIDMGSLYNGSSVPQINNKDIGPLKIKVPPIEKQSHFAEFVQQIDKSKFIVQQQIDKLNNLLNSKMNKYFG